MIEFVSPEAREREKRQGYLQSDDNVVNTLVHFLDYTIAGIGYHQMLKYTWGIDANEIFSVHFNGMLNKLTQAKSAEAGCINCQTSGFLGNGGLDGDLVLDAVGRRLDLSGGASDPNHS